MKKALKTIGTFGAGLMLCFWTYCAYKAGYEECVRDTSYNDLVSENAKLKEELENKEI